MNRQKQWNHFEAVILLDNYLGFLNGTFSRSEAIKKTSFELRKIAQQSSDIIDDIYRNVNGITFQMHSMESAYKGYTLLKPATKLFEEVVQMYKCEKEKFIELLKEAREMITTKDNQGIFVEWLSRDKTPANVSELLLAYKVIDDFCKEKKILECSFLDLTSKEMVKKVQNEIEHNRIFCFNNRQRMNKILEAMRLYISYIMDLPQIIEEHVDGNVISENIDNNTYEPEKKIINFSKIDDLSYTKPLKVLYFEEELGSVPSWKELYVKVFKNLYEDYDYRIPKNKPFNLENGRMDFCTQEYYSSMAAPKEIERGFYLETNLNATDIVRKIKLLLDICLVDEENVVIEFEKSGNQQIVKGSKLSIKGNTNSDAFFDWLSNEQCMADPTCRSYVSAVNIAERFALENGFEHNKLYTNDFSEVKETIDELFSDEEFIEYNIQQHNRFKSALNKLLMYIGDDCGTTEEEKSSVNLEPYIDVLLDKFSKGFRITSPIELRKFKRHWEKSYGTTLGVEDDKILKQIGWCGIKYEDKIYFPQKMLDENIRLKLFSYINNCFLEGKKAIYFEALFKEFSDDFLGYCMYNADMLRAYLDYMNDGNYYVSKNCISKDANVTTDPYDEIKECLINQGTPMEYDDLFSILSHIPEQKIRTTLALNSDFISNGRREYFHINITTFSDEELDDISGVIQYSIDEKHFISGNELVENIKTKYPYVIEQNVLLSENGLRNTIGYRLKDRFSFKGNIISSLGVELSMKEVYEDFCKSKESFTLDELKKLKQDLDTIIYFDVVYENSLRISKEDFVSKSYATFKTKETDAAIDRFCVGDYVAIGKIENFGLFPDAGFSWNSFLLEHYVAMYSLNYKLIHSNYNESACVGGIVKKLSNIDTFDDLIVDVLASNGIALQKEIALQYLCDEGYLARRSYSDIEHALIKAKELRNQKGI